MINVIGLGYIGVPTALMFAANGLKVVGTDLNPKIVDSLKSGKIAFEEEGLEEVFKKAIKSKIEFSTEYIKTNKYIVAVPTPYIEENKKIDATYVINAINKILDICEKGAIIVIESTVSPGTINKFIKPVIEEREFVIGRDIHLVHAPERIIPGRMIHELKFNSRTIGAEDLEVAEEVKSWYEVFCHGDIVITDIKTAEMSKVIENTYRDINIAFANEISRICRKENIDVYELIEIANKHPRVNILQPGPGVGGHCISVDPWFLVGDYPDMTKLISSAREVNDEQPRFILDRINQIMKENNIDNISKVGFYGLTYKENINDIRESPTLQLIQILNKIGENGYKVYDPYIETKVIDGQVYNFEEFMKSIEIIVIMVGHDHLKENICDIKEKIILDTRNCMSLKNKYII